MGPVDLVRMQLVMAFGALEIQRKLVGACWQMALWSIPSGAALPGTGSDGRPAGRRKGRG